MQQVTTVKLHGWLGKKYGKTFKLYVNTVGEAVALLSAQLKGFRQDLVQNNRMFQVHVNNEQKDETELEENTSGKCIRIIPSIAGSGNVAKMVVGAVLVYIGFQTGFAPASSLGWSLIIGGAIGLMFGSTPSSSESNTETKTSYLFSGTVNTVGQGNQVPICLGGPIKIGSQVISAGISTQNI